jgi:hypothetical protein
MSTTTAPDAIVVDAVKGRQVMANTGLRKRMSANAALNLMSCLLLGIVKKEKKICGLFALLSKIERRQDYPD